MSATALRTYRMHLSTADASSRQSAQDVSAHAVLARFPSPSPTNPSTKTSGTQRFLNFLPKKFSHPRLKSWSKKANAPTPILVYEDTDNAGGKQGSRPRASLNDQRTLEQAMSGSIPGSAGRRTSFPSLLVPRSASAGIGSNQNTIEATMEPHDPAQRAAVLSDLNPNAQAAPARSSTLNANAKMAWGGFKIAAKTAKTIVDGTPFKMPIAVINKVIEIAEGIIDNKESMAELLLPLGQRLDVVNKALTEKQLVKDLQLQPTLQRFSSALEETTKKLQNMYDEGLFKRILQLDEHPKELAGIFRRVDEATKNFQLELNLANFKHLNTTKSDVEVSRLRDLRPIFGVRYGGLQRDTCIGDTREDIIKDIISWCKDTSTGSPSLYLLTGMAGTGKSTIASTIGEQLSGDGDASRLAASFFCSRQNANPPLLKHHLRDLLIKPWDVSIGDRESLPPLIVVIDALDELENMDGSSFLEDVLKEIASHPDHITGLKLFITSRRDRHITEIEKTLSSGAIYRLEEVSTDTANKDITTYLTASLPELPLDQRHRLAEQTSGLFIYAATVVRIIIPDTRNPPAASVQKKRLQALLNEWPEKSQRAFGGSLIDHLYEDILRSYFCDRNMTELDQRSSLSVLHTILCAQEPIQVSDIPQLWTMLDMEEDAVLHVVQSLHSVLYINIDSQHIYSYHKSFLDFMFDASRFADQELAAICCPPPDMELQLATSCFRLMGSLRFNICDLPSSFLNDSEVPGLPTVIKTNISSPLTYACRHWAEHLSKIPAADQGMRQEMIGRLQDWFDRRLLFWMEAMNLLKVVGECYHALVTARGWLGLDQIGISKDLIIAENMVAIFGTNIIRDSTPHLYISALSGVLQDSESMKRWHSRFPGIPTVVSILRPGRLLSRFQQEDCINSIASSPNGQHTISGSSDKTIRIWDISTGKQLQQLDGHDDWVNMVAFSPDGLHAISGSRDKTIRIWEMSTGKQLQQLDGHDDWVRSVAFPPDGLRAISGSRDRTIRIWDISTGKQLQQLEGHDDWVNSVASSPDGFRAISGSGDKTIRIWDISTGRQLQQLDGHDHSVSSVAFSPDGLRAISGSSDTSIRIWDISTGKQLQQLDGHDQYVNSVTFSPDGWHAISGSSDKTIRIWDISTGKQLQQLDGHDERVNSVTFSSDGLRVISGSDDKTIRIWDVSTGTQLQQLDGHDHSVNSVAFLPDGLHTISGSYDKTIRIWHVSTGKQLQQLDGHDRPVNSVAFSPDGSCTISGSDDKTIRIWDVSTGKQLQQLDGHDDWVNSVAFSPDGLHAISGSGDKTIRIWDVSTGKQLQQLNGHDHLVNSVAFSPDGLSAISGSDDKTIRIWDVSTGKQLQQLAGHDDWVNSVAFSPDGSCAISGSSNKTIHIWDVSTGKQLQQFDGHDDWVRSVTFSPDGLHAISGSRDRTIRIWDVFTGKQLQQLDGHDAWVNSVAFSPDGLCVVSGSNDKTIRTWPVSHPNTLMEDWHLNANGWITSSTNQRKIWLPHDMHPFLNTPQSSIISSRGSVKVDFRDACLGPHWVQCYNSQAT
ncbi:WD40-repeat-containing domain protein [Mycena capillaripes]|nr:WD40-repeat-containing domain protein [Mycena capillaripes]